MFYKDKYINKIEVLLDKKEKECDFLKRENLILVNKILELGGTSPIKTVNEALLEEKMEEEKIKMAREQETVFSELDKIGGE